jgi:hypothetical protein
LGDHADGCKDSSCIHLISSVNVGLTVDLLVTGGNAY